MAARWVTRTGMTMIMTTGMITTTIMVTITATITHTAMVMRTATIMLPITPTMGRRLLTITPRPDPRRIMSMEIISMDTIPMGIISMNTITPAPMRRGTRITAAAQPVSRSPG